MMFSHKPTLIGERVTLRPFLEEDIPVLLDMIEEEDVIRLTGSAHTTDEMRQPMSLEERERITQIYRVRNTQADRLDLAIVDVSTGQIVGEVVLNEWQRVNQCCNFRILIGAAGQNKGFGTEATRLMLAYGFQTLMLHRIELSVYSFNPRAQRAYEKAGFVQEGTLRDSFCFDGQWHHTLFYSILRQEWMDSKRPLS